jgi:hypothetical protein
MPISSGTLCATACSRRSSYHPRTIFTRPISCLRIAMRTSICGRHCVRHAQFRLRPRFLRAGLWSGPRGGILALPPVPVLWLKWQPALQRPANHGQPCAFGAHAFDALLVAISAVPHSTRHRSKSAAGLAALFLCQRPALRIAIRCRWTGVDAVSLVPGLELSILLSAE